MKQFLIFLLVVVPSLAFSKPATKNLAKSFASNNLNNVEAIKLGSDEHATEFLIFIKKDVPMHYHERHTEIVYILDGEANMTLNKKTLKVKSGDYIRIPKGTQHSVQVTSNIPLKVLSIQTPEFFGQDRVFVKN